MIEAFLKKNMGGEDSFTFNLFNNTIEIENSTKACTKPLNTAPPRETLRGVHSTPARAPGS
jgi:hypothetical protein